MGSQGDDTQGGPLANRQLSGRPRGKRACPWAGARDSGELRGWALPQSLRHQPGQSWQEEGGGGHRPGPEGET